MRKFIFFIFMILEFTNRAHANAIHNLESFVWAAKDQHDVGSLVYNGNAISKILVNVNDIKPGGLYVTKSHCKYPDYELSSYSDAIDYYILIPKSVKIDGGHDIKIDIYHPPENYNIEDSAQEYVLYNKGNNNYRYINRHCQKLGDYKYFSDSWSSQFVLSLNTENIGVGRYTGVIPIKVARVEYYSPVSHWLYRWNLADIRDSVGEVTLPFDINIQNKCFLTPNEIHLAHNGHSIISADGHTTSQTVTVNCTNSGNISLSLSLKALSNPSTPYTEGVGVGLGNGWDAILKVEGQNISTTNPTINMSIPANSGFNIQSILRKTSNSQAGSLSGTAVMEVILQ
ncbi:TPA: PapG chaperone-binding domain-containing protein [Providencia alcalifaciens]|uniref:PapG chaperone-binding domain-containing protein n=1 Tax=Providencia alcalifaciens TaxID=126385 RepID=UPI001CC4E3FE|nr:PapG chaperone-binding domain-containing protein [Providencia alcalifaciens]CAG9435855.1 hypothetical protein NVI2019_NGLDDFDA_03981 [Providencia alcalifaciens]